VSPVQVTELPSAEVQRLWFATLKRDWSSLALVPSQPGGSASEVGRALAKVAALQKDSAVKFVNAEGVDLASASRMIIELTQHVSAGGITIIALDSVIENPAGIPIAMSADAALLCVQLGQSDTDTAERTLELIGKERFLGAVTTD
jgi:hypothetical protein